MRRSITLATAALLLLASNAALAQGSTLRLVERSYEVTPQNMLTLPGSTAGSLIFRTCDDCTSLTRRVSAETVYLLNDRAVPLAEFTAFVNAWLDRSSGQAAVGVYVDRETERVNRVLFRYFNQ